MGPGRGGIHIGGVLCPVAIARIQSLQDVLCRFRLYIKKKKKKKEVVCDLVKGLIWNPHSGIYKAQQQNSKGGESTLNNLSTLSNPVT